MKKIRLQLTSWYSLGILVMILTLLLFFYQASQIVFYRQVEETLRSHLTALAASIGQEAKGAGCGCLSAESTFLSGILQIPGMPTAVLDENRQIIKESVDWRSPEKPLSTYPLNRYFNDKLTGLSYRFLILPVPSNGGPIGFVLMGHPIDAFLTSRAAMAKVMVIFFLGLIAPALFLGRFLAEKALAKEKQFISDIAHSLKTPLAVLQSQLEGSNKLNKQSLINNVKRISLVVAEILETAWLENSQKDKDSTNLSGLLEELAEISQHLGEKKEIKIIKDFPNSPILVAGSKQKLAKAILTVLENAIQYGRKNGQVKLTLGQKGQRVVLQISDNGPGISPKDLPFIFDRFYRGRNGLKTKGSGLGLAIAKNIIENLGGEISLQSTKGRGTTVSISLPAGRLA